MTKYNSSLNVETGSGEFSPATAPVDSSQGRSNIINFPGSATVIAATSSGSATNTIYEPIHDTERWRGVHRRHLEIPHDNFIEVGSAIRELLDSCFERISDSLDETIGNAERSNSFDEWKDLLSTLTRKSVHFNSNHRKILGSLLAATRHLDITDFKNGALKLFVKATNTLRQPRVTKPEARQIVAELLDSKTDISIPMVPEALSEEKIRELDGMMEELILEETKLNG